MLPASLLGYKNATNGLQTRTNTEYKHAPIAGSKVDSKELPKIRDMNSGTMRNASKSELNLDIKLEEGSNNNNIFKKEDNNYFDVSHAINQTQNTLVELTQTKKNKDFINDVFEWIKSGDVKLNSRQAQFLFSKIDCLLFLPPATVEITISQEIYSNNRSTKDQLKSTLTQYHRMLKNQLEFQVVDELFTHIVPFAIRNSDNIGRVRRAPSAQFILFCMRFLVERLIDVSRNQETVIKNVLIDLTEKNNFFSTLERTELVDNLHDNISCLIAKSEENKEQYEHGIRESQKLINLLASNINNLIEGRKVDAKNMVSELINEIIQNQDVNTTWSIRDSLIVKYNKISSKIKELVNNVPERDEAYEVQNLKLFMEPFLKAVDFKNNANNIEDLKKINFITKHKQLDSILENYSGDVKVFLKSMLLLEKKSLKMSEKIAIMKAERKKIIADAASCINFLSRNKETSIERWRNKGLSTQPKNPSEEELQKAKKAEQQLLAELENEPSPARAGKKSKRKSKRKSKADVIKNKTIQKADNKIRYPNNHKVIEVGANSKQSPPLLDKFSEMFFLSEDTKNLSEWVEVKKKTKDHTSNYVHYPIVQFAKNSMNGSKINSISSNSKFQVPGIPKSISFLPTKNKTANSDSYPIIDHLRTRHPEFLSFLKYEYKTDSNYPGVSEEKIILLKITSLIQEVISSMTESSVVSVSHEYYPADKNSQIRIPVTAIIINSELTDSGKYNKPIRLVFSRAEGSEHLLFLRTIYEPL